MRSIQEGRPGAAQRHSSNASLPEALIWTKTCATGELGTLELGFLAKMRGRGCPDARPNPSPYRPALPVRALSSRPAQGGEVEKRCMLHRSAASER